MSAGACRRHACMRMPRYRDGVIAVKPLDRPSLLEKFLQYGILHTYVLSLSVGMPLSKTTTVV
jgi:hypothetical protein